MDYRHAKKLHNEDEILIKATGETLRVVEVENTGRAVIVVCDDGHAYHHRDIR